jgi:hypothetical protein
MGRSGRVAGSSRAGWATDVTADELEAAVVGDEDQPPVGRS